MAVVCGNGLKNINIPINMGTLRFKILKIVSFVFCSLNCGAVSVVVFMPMLFAIIPPVSPLKKGGVLNLFLKTIDHKAG